MQRGLIRLEDGLHTDAEALAFVEYEHMIMPDGEKYYRCVALIFRDGEVIIRDKKYATKKRLAPEKAMEKTVEIAVIDYCSQNGIKSVDIVYALEEEIFADRPDVYGQTADQNWDTAREMYFETKSGKMEVCLNLEHAGGMDYNRLESAL